MERVLSHEVPGHIGRAVTVAGWLHVVRRPGGIIFALLRDRAGLVQVVSEQESHRDLLYRLPVESVLVVTGIATAEPRAPGGVEIRAQRIELISPAAEEVRLSIDKYRVRGGVGGWVACQT